MLGIFIFFILFFLCGSFFFKKESYEEEARENNSFSKKDSTNRSTEITKTKNPLWIKKLNIPTEILKLLWFEDGPFKNFFYITDHTYKSDIFTINFSLSGEQEPSLISTKDKVILNSTVNPMEKLGYFPRFTSLTPEEKGIYLKWLQDPIGQSHIDIGYVFIFYYGLERFLFLEKSQKAFDMILKLREVYKNDSFQFYSSQALSSYSLAYNLRDNFKKITKDEYSSEYVEIKILSKQPLYAKDLIYISKTVGFKNMRYIDNEYNLFEKNLKEILKSQYGKDFLEISKYNFNEMKKKNILFTANTSLRSLSFEVPNLFSETPFCDEVKKILEETHEKTKIELKEKRKKPKKNQQ